MRLAWLCLTISGIATASYAGELYDFDYIATSGPIQSFSFSFTTPGFLAVGDSFNFTPFVVTDGTSQWDFSKGLIRTEVDTGIPPYTCLVFATETGSFDYPMPCAGVLNISFYSLPTVAGTYVPFFWGGGFGDEEIRMYIPNGQIPATGTFTLTITDVPEPSSLGLIAFGLFAMSGLSRAVTSRQRQPEPQISK